MSDLIWLVVGAWVLYMVTNSLYLGLSSSEKKRKWAKNLGYYITPMIAALSWFYLHVNGVLIPNVVFLVGGCATVICMGAFYLVSMEPGPRRNRMLKHFTILVLGGLVITGYMFSRTNPIKVDELVKGERGAKGGTGVSGGAGPAGENGTTENLPAENITLDDSDGFYDSDNAEGAFAELGENIENLRGTLDNQIVRIDNLATHVDNLRIVCDNYGIHLDNYQVQIDNLRAVADIMENRLDNYQLQIDNLRTTSDNFRTHIDNLRAVGDNFTFHIDNLRSVCDGFEISIDNLTVHVNNLRLVCDNFQFHIDNLRTTCDDFEVKIDNMKLHVDNLRAVCDNQTFHIDNLRAAVAYENERMDNLVPVGYWTFDENTGTIAHDLSGNFNNGTLMNGATWESYLNYTPNAVHGGSIRFDGTDDYVDVPDAPSLNFTNAITVMCWFKADTLTGDVRTIMSKGSSGEEFASWYFGVNKGAGYRVRFNFGEADGYVESQVSVGAGVWYHAAATFSNKDNQVRLYVNGTLQDNTLHHSVVLTGTWPLYIGADYYDTNVGGYFDGCIDDARVYNRALSSAEISEIAASGGVFNSIMIQTIDDRGVPFSVQSFEESWGPKLWIDANGGLFTCEDINVENGTNAIMGIATLVAGAATVNTVRVHASSCIFLTVQSPGGTVGTPYVYSRISGNSFVIKSTSATDTSVVAWWIIQPY